MMNKYKILDQGRDLLVQGHYQPARLIFDRLQADLPKGTPLRKRAQALELMAVFAESGNIAPEMMTDNMRAVINSCDYTAREYVTQTALELLQNKYGKQISIQKTG